MASRKAQPKRSSSSKLKIPSSPTKTPSDNIRASHDFFRRIFPSLPPLGSDLKTAQGYSPHEAYLAPAATSYNSSPKFIRMVGDLMRGIKVYFRIPIAYTYNSNINLTGQPNTGRPGLAITGSYSGVSTSTLPTSSLGINFARMVIQSPSSTSSSNYFLGVAFPANLAIVFLASIFTKWRHTKDMRVTHEPGLNTDNEVQFRLNWTKDPSNPTYGFAATSARLPSPTDIDDTPNSTCFSGWAPACLDCPTDKEWHYTWTTPQYVSDGTSGGYLPSEIRDICSGQLNCITTRFDGSGSSYQTGVLFAETEIEFSDPLPNGTGESLSLIDLKGLVQMMPGGFKLESEDDEKKDDGVVVENSVPAPLDPGVANLATRGTISLSTPSQRVASASVAPFTVGRKG